jgi:hypothetical protein
MFSEKADDFSELNFHHNVLLNLSRTNDILKKKMHLQENTFCMHQN